MPLIPETILEEDEEEEEDEPVPHKTEPEPESHVGTKITEVNEESSTDQEKEITGNHILHSSFSMAYRQAL